MAAPRGCGGLLLIVLFEACQAERPLTHRRYRAAALSDAARSSRAGASRDGWSPHGEPSVERAFGLRPLGPPASLGERRARPSSAAENALHARRGTRQGQRMKSKAGDVGPSAFHHARHDDYDSAPYDEEAADRRSRSKAGGDAEGTIFHHAPADGEDSMADSEADSGLGHAPDREAELEHLQDETRHLTDTAAAVEHQVEDIATDHAPVHDTDEHDLPEVDDGERALTDRDQQHMAVAREAAAKARSRGLDDEDDRPPTSGYHDDDHGPLSYSRVAALLKDLAAESHGLRDAFKHAKEHASVSVDASQAVRHDSSRGMVEADKDFASDEKGTSDDIARSIGEKVGRITNVLRDVQGHGTVDDVGLPAEPEPAQIHGGREEPTLDEEARDEPHEEQHEEQRESYEPPSSDEQQQEDDKVREEDLKTTLQQDGLSKEEVESALQQVHEMGPARQRELLDSTDPQQVAEAVKLRIPVSRLKTGTHLYARMQDCSQRETPDAAECETVRKNYEAFLEQLKQDGAQIANTEASQHALDMEPVIVAK